MKDYKKIAEEKARKFTSSNRTIGGGDAGWIECAYREGYLDAIEQEGVDELKNELKQKDTQIAKLSESLKMINQACHDHERGEMIDRMHAIEVWSKEALNQTQ